MLDKVIGRVYNAQCKKKESGDQPMKKTLYSLMLNEEVVREIDRMAHRMGTNRSALINQILADYTSVVTPERRIENIFHEIEQLVAPARDLVPFFAPHTTSMSLKSSLEYKYRPTVKYEVALYGDKQEGLGELAVIFRTQSAQLLQSMTQFFRLWKQIEDAHLSGVEPDYALYDGKFVRTLSLPPDHDYTSEEIARAISDYVQLFDRLMKAYLAGKYTPPEIEALSRSARRSSSDPFANIHERRRCWPEHAATRLFTLINSPKRQSKPSRPPRAWRRKTATSISRRSTCSMRSSMPTAA